MKELTSLMDLFHHQLRDIYNAETQLVKALPEIAENASDDNLKQAFKDHLDETKNHVARLEKIGKSLDIKITGETCEAMKGLIKEAEELVHEDAEFHEDAESNVRDAGIIADAQRIEHYEISAYGTVVEYAKALDEREITKQLDKTLEEEKEADEELNELAIDAVNVKAKVGK